MDTQPTSGAIGDTPKVSVSQAFGQTILEHSAPRPYLDDTEASADPRPLSPPIAGQGNTPLGESRGPFAFGMKDIVSPAPPSGIHPQGVDPQTLAPQQPTQATPQAPTFDGTQAHPLPEAEATPFAPPLPHSPRGPIDPSLVQALRPPPLQGQDSGALPVKESHIKQGVLSWGEGQIDSQETETPRPVRSLQSLIAQTLGLSTESTQGISSPAQAAQPEVAVQPIPRIPQQTEQALAATLDLDSPPMEQAPRTTVSPLHNPEPSPIPQGQSQSTSSVPSHTPGVPQEVTATRTPQAPLPGAPTAPSTPSTIEAPQVLSATWTDLANKGVMSNQDISPQLRRTPRSAETTRVATGSTEPTLAIDEGEARLLDILSRPKAPLASGSFYRNRRPMGAMGNLDALYPMNVQSESSDTPEPAQERTPGPVAQRTSPTSPLTQTPVGHDGEARPETADTRWATREDSKPLEGETPQPMKAKSPLGSTALKQGPKSLLGHLQPNVDGQLNQPQADQGPSGTERLQALRETQLPRILDAIQVKITQMGQGMDTQLPARAVVDVRDPQLGRLKLDLSMKEGKLSIQVQHATPEVQAMLESSHGELQQHLEKQGLSLGEFSAGGGEGDGQGEQGRQEQGGRQGTHEHDPDKHEAPAKPLRRSAPSTDGLVDTVV